MKPMIVYTKFLKIKTKTKLSQLRIIQRKQCTRNFFVTKYIPEIRNLRKKSNIGTLYQKIHYL